jgi:NTE family protein
VNGNIGVMISGGAPTVHLAAGALCKFHEHQQQSNQPRFSVIGTAGAGALPGLLYAAPKGGDAAAALKSVVNLNVYDAIYRLIPANFKVFFKYGPFSQFFYQLAHAFPRFKLSPDERYADAPQRLYNDLLDLAMTAITPTTLNPRSRSVLTRVEVVNELVDWAALKAYPGNFYLNAFSFKTRELELFDKNTMTPERFYAALAMPWLYPPTDAGGSVYTEGASHDPSALRAIMQNQAPDAKILEAMIMIDTLGSKFWVDPESLYEALQLTILDPLVTLSENVVSVYAFMEVLLNRVGVAVPRIYRLQFDVPQWECGKLMEWSYANALTLWDVGYKAAETFLSDAAAATRDAAARAEAAPTLPPDKYRYLSTLGPDSREEDFLQLLGVRLPVGPGGAA